MYKLHNLLSCYHNVDEMGRGSRYKLPGPDSPERDPDPEYVTHVFVFLGSIIICRLYKLTISDQAQVTVQLRVSLSDLVSRFLAGLQLLGDRRKDFHWARTRSRRPWVQVAKNSC